MKRIAAVLFVVVAANTSVSARSPFQLFRSSTPSRPAQPATSQRSTTENPLSMSDEQLEKIYGPSILVQDVQVTQKANTEKSKTMTRFVTQPSDDQ
ncbi:hypothetical protein [Novipirellula caenicola]|uniref:Uncharacterized protein n=1 Tax=Novipirellula caenicola TaxID=1536901 RepID=A0ABP9W1P6_9BACT